MSTAADYGDVVAPSPAGYPPEIDGIEFGEVHAEVRGDLSETDLLEAVRIAALMHRSSTWWLGDLLAHGGGREIWDDYAQAAAATGFAAGSLKNMASVSRKVPPERRVPGLHWRTHRVVMALEPDEQRTWLKYATDEGLTSDELARAIKQASGNEPREPEDPVGDAHQCPHCAGTGILNGGSS